MANLTICAKNVLEGFSFSPTTVTAGIADNLKTGIRSQTATVAYNVSGSVVAAQSTVDASINFVCLYRHNLASTDTYRVQLYSDFNGTVQVYDSGTLSAYTPGLFSEWDFGFSVHYMPSTVTNARYIKVTVNRSASNDLVLNRLYAGVTTVAQYNPKWGISLGYETNAEQSRTVSGSLLSRNSAVWRCIDFDLNIKTEAERATWNTLFRQASMTKDTFVSFFPGASAAAQERDYCMIGRFKEIPKITWSAYEVYDAKCSILEI